MVNISKYTNKANGTLRINSFRKVVVKVKEAIIIEKGKAQEKANEAIIRKRSGSKFWRSIVAWLTSLFTSFNLSGNAKEPESNNISEVLKTVTLCKLLKTITLWLWGGFIYYCVELLWRGYSHPSMFIVGGICFLLVGGINNWFPWSLGLLWQALIGAGFITAVELVAGVILNIRLGLGIWDYSDMPFSFLGQICLQYSLFWIPLAAFGVWLDDFLRWKLYGDEVPRYTII